MRRVQVFAFAAVFLLTAGFWGCAGSANVDSPLPPTLATVKPARGYVKKIAVALTQAPTTAMGAKLGDLFFKTLVESIRSEGKRLQVVTSEDEAFPVFMAQIGRQPGTPIDAIKLARQGREAGYNGLVSAALLGIRPYTKKTGILWFRKVRYFISFDMTVDLYDPLTAAKIVGAVEEASIKVSEVEFEAFTEGNIAEVEELEEEIVDLSEELGERVADSLQDIFWSTSVVRVEGDRIYLPAGQQAGLKPGVRLSVFEGRRVMNGMGRERFIVPGPQVGTIQISSSALNSAEAVVAGGSRPIQPGDIVIPVK